MVSQKLMAIFFIFFFWGAVGRFGVKALTNFEGRLKNQTRRRERDSTKRKKSTQFLVVTLGWNEEQVVLKTHFQFSPMEIC